MTCIVNFKTKKALKEHVAEHNDFHMEDPSIFKPYSGQAMYYITAGNFMNGSSFAVTNHPKRSWFASISLKNGKLVVS